jgi:hypothetical protein
MSCAHRSRKKPPGDVLVAIAFPTMGLPGLICVKGFARFGMMLFAFKKGRACFHTQTVRPITGVWSGSLDASQARFA